jgi:hypothetical protein
MVSFVTFVNYVLTHYLRKYWNQYLISKLKVLPQRIIFLPNVTFLFKWLKRRFYHASKKLNKNHISFTQVYYIFMNA